MRFRLGFTVGFAVGYYLGSRAGRERYEQINDLLGRLRRSEAVETAADKAKAVVDVGVERAKDVVGDRFGSSGPSGGLDDVDSVGVPSAGGPNRITAPEAPPPFGTARP